MKKISIIFSFLFVLLCSCNDDDDTIDPDDIIKLEIFDFDGLEEISGMVIGDGETTVTLRATIPENSDENSRTVTFQASNNAIFQGVGTNLDSDVAGSDGIAEAKLRMPLDNDPVFVSASITKGDNTYTSKASISLMGVDDIVSLELLDASQNPINESPRADGQTLITLKATVNFNQEEFDQVTFEKSAGQFQSVSDDNPIRVTNETNTAMIDLRLPTIVDRLYLLAKVGTSPSYFKEVDINLLRAYPDEIIIQPDKLSMTENDDNTIKIFLNRDFGMVSQGTPIFPPKSFQLANGEEIEVGRFTGLDGAQTNQNGEINIVFRTDTGDIDPNLPVIIRVSARNDDDNVIESMFSISIN